MALTIASICSWENSASRGCASRAARASARASAMEARSLSLCLGDSWAATLQLREDPFDFRVWPRNDMNRHELPDASRRRGAGVCCGLDRPDVPTDEHRHVALA